MKYVVITIVLSMVIAIVKIVILRTDCEKTFFAHERII
jgi:lipopolysaccharide/colanic/teichoic acid biosynthesis glycosyltransferase